MKNWFKIVISLFLFGVLYLGWSYIQVQKEIALNGRYEILFNGSAYFDKWTNTVCKSQFKN